jgi:hypothetical protein
VNYSTEFQSIGNEVSAQEWQTRIDLAACEEPAFLRQLSGG